MNRKEEPAWSMKLTRLVRFSIRINMDCLLLTDAPPLLKSKEKIFSMTQDSILGHFLF